MSGDNKSKISSNQNIYKGLLFEQFVIECLKLEFPDKILLARDNENKFDCYSSDSLGFFKNNNKKLFIEIKFANNIGTILEFSKLKFKDNNNYLLIGIWSNESINKIKNLSENLVVLGYEYILTLTEKYPLQWWTFVASNYNDAKITLDLEKKQAILNVKGEEDFIPAAEIKVNEIDALSKLNKNEYIRCVKNNNNNTAIFIGNGVSIPFGSDTWDLMSDNIYDYLYPLYIDDKEKVKTTIGNSTYSITSIAKVILPQDMYYNAIWECIYRKYNQKYMHNSKTLIRSINNAKIKHNELKLYTYNYDTFIENDFKIEFKNNMNSATSMNDKKTIEPKIVHLHGIIKYDNRNASHVPNNVILTDDDYYRLYKKHNWVYETQYNVLKNNVCLYVGSSMSDLYQMSVINDVRNKIIESKDKQYWKCFALVCLQNLTPKDKLSVLKYYMSKGVYLIFVDNFSELPHEFDELMDF